MRLYGGRQDGGCRAPGGFGGATAAEGGSDRPRIERPAHADGGGRARAEGGELRVGGLQVPPLAPGGPHWVAPRWRRGEIRAVNRRFAARVPEIAHPRLPELGYHYRPEQQLRVMEAIVAEVNRE